MKESRSSISQYQHNRHVSNSIYVFQHTIVVRASIWQQNRRNKNRKNRLIRRECGHFFNPDNQDACLSPVIIIYHVVWAVNGSKRLLLRRPTVKSPWLSFNPLKMLPLFLRNDNKFNFLLVTCYTKATSGDPSFVIYRESYFILLHAKGRTKHLNGFLPVVLNTLCHSLSPISVRFKRFHRRREGIIVHRRRG